jgi:hypothetical protein
VIVALLGACASSGQTGGTSAADAPSAAEVAPAPRGVALAASFFGTLPGEARLVPGSGANRTQVTLTVRGGSSTGREVSSGQAMAWQIKRGLCNSPSEAVEIGRRSLYPALLVRGDGTATFKGSINLPFPDGAPHFVVVTASRSDDTVLACADLRPSST